MEKLLKIYSVDNGFCRVNYSVKNEENQTVYYCIQEEFDDVFVCYRSTAEEEPQYKVVCIKSIWEVPTGNSTIEKGVRKFLTGED